MRYRIKSKNDTYFQRWTGIGPMFGGTKKEAMIFDTKEQAINETSRHSFAFVGCKIESAKKEGGK
jgi:hypothetical protein